LIKELEDVLEKKEQDGRKIRQEEARSDSNKENYSHVETVNKSWVGRDISDDFETLGVKEQQKGQFTRVIEEERSKNRRLLEEIRSLRS